MALLLCLEQQVITLDFARGCYQGQIWDQQSPRQARQFGRVASIFGALQVALPIELLCQL